jgi:hypothetical protein
VIELSHSSQTGLEWATRREQWKNRRTLRRFPVTLITNPWSYFKANQRVVNY